MTASDFATRYRASVRKLYESRTELKTFLEINASTGIAATLPDGPLDGANADITKAVLLAAMTAAGELETHLTDYTQNPNVPTATNMALQKLL